LVLGIRQLLDRCGDLFYHRPGKNAHERAAIVEYPNHAVTCKYGVDRRAKLGQVTASPKEADEWK